MEQFCSSHEKMIEEVSEIRTEVGITLERIVNLDKRINGALESIAQHMEEGIGWRKVIVTLLISVFIQVGAFIYLFAQMNKQVEINTKRLNILEDLHPRVQSNGQAFTR